MIMVEVGHDWARRSMRVAAVAASRALLNSSSTSIEPGRRRARAMAMRCAWPSLRPPPASSHEVSRPRGRVNTKSAAAVCRAWAIRLSVASGSARRRLSRMVPGRSELPWGT